MKKRALIIFVVVFGIGAIAAVPALAIATRDCNNTNHTIAPGSTVTRSVVVRQGNLCDLDGVTIQGTLFVHEGATVDTHNTVTITKDFIATGAQGVHLQSNVLIGRDAIIQSTQASEELASQRVCGSIQGDLTITGTVASTYFIVGQNSDNGGACPSGQILTVGGTITWSDNANQGALIGDTSSSLVVCKNNAYRPTGTNNSTSSTAGKNHNGLTGQCSSLGGGF